jgi:hypothetical protein
MESQIKLLLIFFLDIIHIRSFKINFLKTRNVFLKEGKKDLLGKLNGKYNLMIIDVSVCRKH